MHELTIGEAALRIAFALGAGMVVGWERESRGRPAGFRTTILTCVAACIAMIISEDLFAATGTGSPAGSWRPDPARLGAGILTGIGFLGAGTIIRHGSFVRGVTTAASLWFVTVLGLAFGGGQIALGCLGTAVALVVLLVLPLLEKKIASDWFGTLTVVSQTGALPVEDVRKRIASLGLQITKLSFTADLEKRQDSTTCEIKIKRPQRFESCAALSREALQWPGVVRVSWN